jgi:hypothetical protein
MPHQNSHIQFDKDLFSNSIYSSKICLIIYNFFYLISLGYAAPYPCHPLASSLEVDGEGDTAGDNDLLSAYDDGMVLYLFAMQSRHAASSYEDRSSIKRTTSTCCISITDQMGLALADSLQFTGRASCTVFLISRIQQGPLGCI